MPTKIVKTEWQAFDATPFVTEEACNEYEAENWLAHLGAATKEQVEAAIAGDNDSLAAALERAGYLCAKNRKARGITKRSPNGTRAAEEAMRAITYQAPGEAQ